MGSTIVNKGTRTPSTQQKRINPQLVERALGNGLQVAHDCLLCLLDIGEHYAQSPFSTETMRSIALQYAGDASNSADCGIEEIRGMGIAKDAAHEVGLCVDTAKRMHDFFYKDHGEHLRAMEPDVIGNLILGMVKPSGIHLERGVKLLGYDGGGFDAFTSEFGSGVLNAERDIPGIKAPEPAAVSHSTETARGRAASKAIQKVHGELHALLDLGKQSDLWPYTFITLGDVLCPLAAATDEGLAKVEGFLPSPWTPQEKSALDEIMKALEYAEALSFFSKYLLAGEAGNFDSDEFEEKEDRPEYWSDWTKDRLLSCLGGIVVSLVHRIALHCDRACEALGEKCNTIDLDFDLRNPIE